MAVFTPRQRSEIKAEIDAQVLAFAPLTSSELGEVIDNINFGVADQIYNAYVEQVNALQLLNLENTTGSELDLKRSEFPVLEPRFDSSRGTGSVTVKDPAITKISGVVAAGGAAEFDTFLNVDLGQGPAFGTTGFVLIGVRGSASFETFQYDGRTGDQLTSSGGDAIESDHGSGEPVVKTTVGDRTFPGPFSFGTLASSTTPAKTYTSTGQLDIFDGEEEGTMAIQADVLGLDGNTPDGTINQFIGTPPFPGAEVTNNLAVSNGTAKERDSDLRSRIRREQQALSTANVDAVVGRLFGVNNNGQRIRFVQIIEEVDPTIPDIAYIDDGSGFVPTSEFISAPIIVIDAAVGAERRFQMPRDIYPIITNDAENALRIFGNFVLELNSIPLVQGSGPNDYRIQPDNGVIVLNNPEGLDPGDHLEITTGTKHFTGLIQAANNALYGDRNDRANFPSIVGLGQWVQLRAPIVSFVPVLGNAILDGSRTIADVVAEIKANMVAFINNLGIGQTVVRNRLSSLGFVPGVKDFILSNPGSDVIISDGSLAKTSTGIIVIS